MDSDIPVQTNAILQDHPGHFTGQRDLPMPTVFNPKIKLSPTWAFDRPVSQTDLGVDILTGQNW